MRQSNISIIEDAIVEKSTYGLLVMPISYNFLPQDPRI